MSLLDRLFGRTKPAEPQPEIPFGRYSDSYKEESNHQAWTDALEHFENERYLESFESFFRYLRDDSEDNVRFWAAGKDALHFEFYQGSKKITGKANRDGLKAEAKIARTQSLNVGFMRRLIEKNFSLKYSRFALDEGNNLTIVFDTYSLDGSPYKLYYALKEVATNADKQDDLLLDEFRSLEPVDTSHLTELPEAEKAAKYNFTTGSIQRVLDEIDQNKLDPNQYPGGIAFLLLHTVYKLDYLVKPEGYMMETLEHANRAYYSKDSKTTVQKNKALRRELQQLLDRPREEFFKEMYRGKSTFGITNPVEHEQIVTVIDAQLQQLDWYLNNGHENVALAIPGYVVGYCLFNFAVPRPDHDLFHLYYRITEADYFESLGFTQHFIDLDSGKLDKKAIRKAIGRIAGQNSQNYPKLRPDTSVLEFSDLPRFARSFLHMLRQLDLSKST